MPACASPMSTVPSCSASMLPQRSARVDLLDADVGHQLRVALYECLAERPEVAGREAGRQPDRDGLLGSGRLDASPARRRRTPVGARGPGADRTRRSVIRIGGSCVPLADAGVKGLGILCRNLSQFSEQPPVKIASINQSLVCFSGGSMRIWWRAVLLAVFVSAGGERGAQALYGSLVGNVTDETGAALPGATVTMTQRETNLVARRRHQRNRRLQRAEPAAGHLPGRRQASGIFDIHRARHRRPPGARRPRRRAN